MIEVQVLEERQAGHDHQAGEKEDPPPLLDGELRPFPGKSCDHGISFLAGLIRGN
jgi:hypothetical protein